MNKATTVFLVIMAAGLLWAGALMSAPGGIPGRPEAHSGGDYAEGELLVKFRKAAGERGRDRVRYKVGALSVREFKGLGIQRIKVSPGLSVEAALEELMDDPDVEYAEPNYRRHGLWTPDDTGFVTLWGMTEINSPEAWDIQNTCAPKIAVLDSGVANHVDLQGRLGVGTDEYDFANNQAVAYDDWLVDGKGNTVNGHGTHVAGTIAAIANNAEGVAGVCASGASIMDLKILDSTGSGYISDEIEAINHARDNGAKVINLSLGGYNCSLSEQDAINSFGLNNGLVVAAAGNEGRDNDISPSFPASYGLPYVISVAASDTFNGLAYFGAAGSNHGYYSTDLAAPGIDIYSTILNTSDFTLESYEYAYKQGTSMAAPHVAGVVALINTAFPGMTNTEIRAQLLGTVNRTGMLDGIVATEGIMNAHTALLNTVPATPTDLSVVIANSTEVQLSWTDNATDEGAYRIERMAEGESRFSLLGLGFINAETATDTSIANGSAAYYYRVRATKSMLSPAASFWSEPSNIVGVNADANKLYTAPTCAKPVPYATGGGGGGCFIATAAYGTSISPELGALRSFRDNVLNRSTLGRSIVAFYYRNSPPLADTIKQSSALRATVREAIAPMILALKHPFISAGAILLMVAALIISGAIKERQTRMTRNILNEKGFTLLEILVVLAILSLLVAYVAPKLIGYTDDARVDSAKMQIGSFVSALKLFRNDNGFYPTTEQGLEALVSKPTVGREPKKYRSAGYMDKIPLDPWGNPYVYISPGVQGDMDVISLGADGVEGGGGFDADITNWD
jgi:type II secretion system protein G